ncbi:hypothetical protein DFH29DRAFT_993986 [Suillus ampliporus]|nr:hypothetical protein DFH29DRAFT_993986 [Suillus ampliporus]
MRTSITDILAGCHSEVARGNVDSWDSGVDLRGIIPDELQTIAPVGLDGLDAVPWLPTPLDLSLLSQPPVFHAQFLGQQEGLVLQESVGVTSALPEMADPVGQLSPDSLLSGTSDPVTYELGAQPFQFVPQDGMCSEGQTLSGSSARSHQQLCLPVMQDDKEKVKCTWLGCWSVIKKDNYTRHVNEIHLRQGRAFCTSCGKMFQRSYMKKKHICPGRHPKRRSSQTMKLPKGV